MVNQLHWTKGERDLFGISNRFPLLFARRFLSWVFLCASSPRIASVSREGRRRGRGDERGCDVKKTISCSFVDHLSIEKLLP